MSEQAEPAAPRKCAYAIPMKHRTCNLPAREGSLYCATHDPAAADRVPCPKDPRHTVRTSNLARHLKRCKGRSIERVCGEPFYSRGVNCADEGETEAGEKGPLCRHPERVDEVVALLWRLAAEPDTRAFMAQEPEARVLVFDRADEVERGMFRSAASRKHGPQVSSIVENMRQAGFVAVPREHASSTAFVEFGAGKAHLAKVVAAAVLLEMGLPVSAATEPPPPKRAKKLGDDEKQDQAVGAAAAHDDQAQQQEKVGFVLVDRAKFAASTEHSSWGRVLSRGVAFTRVQIDISDLVLARVPALARAVSPPPGVCGRVVAFGKHVCGMACDTALRCVVQARQAAAATQTQFGVAIAMCCLHRCTWAGYCNTAFLRRHGVDEQRFAVLIGIAAWATSGPGTAKEQQEQARERRAVGILARRLLAEGRLAYLRDNGFADARVVRFVDETTSPENWLLLARSSNWAEAAPM